MRTFLFDLLLEHWWYAGLVKKLCYQSHSQQHYSLSYISNEKQHSMKRILSKT